MARKVEYSLRITILFLMITEHTISFMIPTIIVYYLEDLLDNPETDGTHLQEISVKMGILEGCYGICAVIGGVLSGLISDQIGRKTSLIIILSGVFVTSLGFGLAPNYEMALLSRILAGFCAGIIPMTKTLIIDLIDDSNIGIFYSYYRGGYGAASILGQLFGAVLSKSSKLYPGSEKVFF
jgi:MFS family permease